MPPGTGLDNHANYLANVLPGTVGLWWFMELGQSEADNNDDKGNVEAQNRIICFTMLPENLIIESLPYSTVSRHYFLAGSPWHVTQLGEAEPSLARQLKHSH